MNTPYAHLFTPITLAHLTLPNRIVMGSMHTGLEDRPWHFGKLAAFYRERAEAGAALIVTGGFAPDVRGRLTPLAGTMSAAAPLWHRRITRAVHDAGSRVLMQLLHAGRYGYHPLVESASALRSPISPYTPRAMSDARVQAVVADFARAAKRAQRAGYDGVEVMGSEGYLINQFLSARTNRRSDRWGGGIEGRMQFALAVAGAVRRATGEDFVVMFRLSLLDLVEGGNTMEETIAVAQALASRGVTLLNSGIGWHEARIPTIGAIVPRGAFRAATARVRQALSIPVVASNRINTPALAEDIVASGDADMVSMARPFLADPAFVAKARDGRADDINTCIACNQACLDRTFTGRRATCMVNPRACRETELVYAKAAVPKRVGVVGAGVAGLALACVAAERGHAVTLFEADECIGGQFRLAMQVPGKEDFAETLRYFTRRLDAAGVTLRLGQRVEARDLDGFDVHVVASGVAPRLPGIPGIAHPSVMTYADLLSGRRVAGARVAVVGAGGVGVDVCAYLIEPPGVDVAQWCAEWGVDLAGREAGGLVAPRQHAPRREVTLLQRKPDARRMGAGPGKTTGWAHRVALKRNGVTMIAGVEYLRIDDAGLTVRVDGAERTLAVDTIVLCAGQVSQAALADGTAADARVHVIGGAREARELDAESAIREACELAARL